MKKIIYLMLIVVVFSSCATLVGRFRKTEDVSLTEQYRPLRKVKVSASSEKFWILFFSYGGKSDQSLYNEAYKNAMEKTPEADGITSQMIEYTRFTLPLIVFTYVGKTMKLTGVTYEIKKDTTYLTQSERKAKNESKLVSQVKPKIKEVEQEIKKEIKPVVNTKLGFNVGDKIVWSNPKNSQIKANAIIQSLLSNDKALIKTDDNQFMEVSIINIVKQ